MKPDKTTKYILFGLAAALVALGFLTKNYLAFIYLALGVVIGLAISKTQLR